MNDIIKKIGYIRNKAELSARELSLMIDKTPSYINKLENSGFNMTLQTLLDIISACNCTTEEFFYDDIENYKLDKELLNTFKKLPNDKKQAILTLLK